MTDRAESQHPSSAQIEHLGFIRISGPEACSFLQAVTTNQVHGRPAGQPFWNGLCDAKGRVLALFLQWPGPDSQRLLLPVAQHAATSTLLRRLILRAKVTLSAEPAAVYGQFATSPSDPVPAGWSIWPDGSDQRRIGTTPPTAPGPGIDPAHWHWLDVGAGLPWLSEATAGRHLPQVLGLDARDGVSFSKGCYPGQEIIARARYVGQVRRHLLGVELPPGTPLPEVGTEVALEAAGTTQAAEVFAAAARPGQPPRLLLVADHAGLARDPSCRIAGHPVQRLYTVIPPMPQDA